MLKHAVYISSDDRSGSTMLDLMLANHPEVFCVGELHNLPAYVFNERGYYNPVHELNCMCGTSVGQCPFWQKVGDEVGSLEGLRLRHEKMFKGKWSAHLNDPLTGLMRHILNYRPQILKSRLMARLLGLDTLACNYFKVYNAVAKVSGKTHVVDSSKWPYRFHGLFSHQPEKVKVILLYRDPAAVVYSKYRRHYASISSGAAQWRQNSMLMKLFSREIPKESKMTIRYEDICKETEATMRRLCDFLEIRYDPALSRLKKKNLHHIGGSPSKFKTEQTRIRYDDRYKRELTREQLQTIARIVGNVNDIYDFCDGG
jgi:hypothetical protein